MGIRAVKMVEVIFFTEFPKNGFDACSSMRYSICLANFDPNTSIKRFTLPIFSLGRSHQSIFGITPLEARSTRFSALLKREI
ncbi:Cell division protein [Dirofilaria immitis]